MVKTKLKWAIGLAAIGFMAFGGDAYAEGLGTGIATVGSPHNFADNVAAGAASGDIIQDEDGNDITVISEIGAGGWNQREEICRVCHVPHDHHRSEMAYAEGLLWNHSLSEVTDYVLYDSDFLEATPNQPTGVSKLCLGCHDGTVAIDSFDGYADTASVDMDAYEEHFIVPGVGTNDLSQTHPISMVYDVAGDGNLNATDTTMGTSGSIEDVLQNGVVQCSSCHDVHDQESVADTHLLRVAQTAGTVIGQDGNGDDVMGTASGLCLTCHIK